MEKALVQIILGHFIFICKPISIILVALFKTFGIEKDDKIRFVSGCFKNMLICKKVVSKGWCKESSEIFGN